METAIRELGPTVPTDPDAIKKFWAVYNEVTGKYDDDMISKYTRDLDTILLFVSTFISITRFVPVHSIPFFLY